VPNIVFPPKLIWKAIYVKLFVFYLLSTSYYSLSILKCYNILTINKFFKSVLKNTNFYIKILFITFNLRGKIMASTGNNTSAQNAEIRDNFLCNGESAHLNNLIKFLEGGNKLPNLFNNLNSNQLKSLHSKINSALPKQQTNHSGKLLRTLRYYLEHKDIDWNYIQNLYFVDDDLKRIYAESVISCVDEGVFDDDFDMTHAENFLAITLGSIVDFQMIMEMER
jgi:hypothetical protein